MNKELKTESRRVFIISYEAFQIKEVGHFSSNIEVW